MSVSNWNHAVAHMKHQRIEVELRCDKCPAQNRPGATIIELQDDNKGAYCGQCGHYFEVQP